MVAELLSKLSSAEVLIVIGFSVISFSIATYKAIISVSKSYLESNIKKDKIFIELIVNQRVEQETEELNEKVKILEADMKRANEKRADDILRIFNKDGFR